MPLKQKELSVPDQRLAFVRAVQEEGWSMSEACQSFGISRPTGYKILHRFEQEGVAGLIDRSRAPLHRPQTVIPEVIAQILADKATHPNWGPKKLKAHHEAASNSASTSPSNSPSNSAWPAASTIGEILKRSGLTRARRRQFRSSSPPSVPVLSPAEQPNQVWGSDYKGQFQLGDGLWCYPLTITDLNTRFLIRCQALPDVCVQGAWPYFVGAFQEYGLPQAIRTDNGVPFAVASVTGLTRLSLKLIQLGIVPERIAPGKPQQNGCHERFHRTLKAETIHPKPAQDMVSQQQRFDHWRPTYNQERPHEALGLRPPAALYTPSPRPFPARLPSLDSWSYPEGMSVHKVRPSGAIRWRAKELFICNLLCGAYVALDHFSDGHHALYVGFMPLAILDERAGRFLPPDQATSHLIPIRQQLLQRR